MMQIQFDQEEMDIMRIAMNKTQVARLRESGGALLPWSQCAFR